MDFPSLNAFFQAFVDVLNHPVFSLGQRTLTLGLIGKFILLFAGMVLMVRLFTRVFLARALTRMNMEPSLQFAVTRIVGYGLFLLGGYVVLNFIGVELSSLAVFAGAIGVGLGFGLQNITNNFISGIIILAERPIKLGDRVEVATVAGRVTKISLRSTTVVTNDNISIIVPNSEFITQTVTNWSHSDPRVRIRIPFSVAYGTDTDKLNEVIMSVAAADPAVLKEPAPALFFDGFGDSALNFELGVWTQDLASSPRRFRSQINYAIDRALRDAKIEIPFPQRDLHIRSGTLNVKQTDQDGAE
ncbi:MAG: mechanosensitive ion channel [Candidatus Didemnitutus sp.]|nr:mechanosensitive ion channel [Candidatus Didemnitutus sp.]